MLGCDEEMGGMDSLSVALVLGGQEEEGRVRKGGGMAWMDDDMM